MRRRQRLQAFEPDGLVPDGPRVVEEPLGQAAPRTNAAHVRPNVHPLDFGNAGSQPFQAPGCHVGAVVANQVEPPIRRVELRPIVEIRLDHRIDVERKTVVLPGHLSDPTQVLADQLARGLGRRDVVDSRELKRWRGHGVSRHGRPSSARAS